MYNRILSRVTRDASQVSRRYLAANAVQPILKPQLPETRPFINNEWVDALGGETYKAFNPTTGQVITEIQRGKKEDVDRAVQAAKDAFKLNSEWRKMDASYRGVLINKWADLVERDAVLIASLETLECGKVFATTLKGDLQWTIKLIRYFAGLADKNNGQTLHPDGPYICYTLHEPVGVCGLITAWNFASLMAAWKIAPALAAGCTMVIKPSQHSTLATLHMVQLAKEAGIPAGVLNAVPGQGDVGAALVDNPDVDKISFTGSTPIGKGVYTGGAKSMKRMVLELGGKSPNIILEDADIDKAVEHAHLAAFHNMGQCCCAGSRTYVQESIYEKFIEKSVQRIKARKVGNPFELGIDHGPQATKDQMESILRMIESGKKEGAKLMVGGNKIEGDGYFVQPTLFADVEDQMKIAREEIFGPVQQVLPFKTVDEVIERANDSDYGLASSVFTNDLSKAHQIMQSLRTGSVWVNCYYLITPQAPFGGYKQSGIGREGSNYSLSSYTEVKTVYVKTPTKIS